MRNLKTTALALVAAGALMAAAAPQETADSGVLAERTLLIRIPLSGTNPPLPADIKNYETFASAAGLGNGKLAIIKEAQDRAPIPPPYSSPWSVSGMDESLQSGQIMVRLRVERMENVAKGEGPSVAQANKLADAFTDVIRERVTREWEEVVAAHKASLASGKQDAADAGDRLKAAREQVAADEAKLRKETGRIDLSEAGMQASQDALELERQKVELDLAGLKARQDALQKAVAQQAEKVDAAKNDDVVARALAKAVEAAKMRLQEVQQQYKSGVATGTEVSQAQLAELDAEARLAERQSAAGGSAEAMAQWNRELTDAAIEQREEEARLSAATKRLESLMDATAQRKELEAARNAEAAAARDLADAEARVSKSSEWLDRYGDQRPTVEVRQGFAAATEPAK